MLRWLVLACALVAALHSAIAADEKPETPQTLDALDRQLAETFRALNIPGANVAVIESGQVVLAKGYGFADVAAKTAVTPDTVFRAGSISKSFVGVAVMMLVEESRLDLNAKLADLAPEIEFDNPWEATDPVRLVHLMEHTTGFDDIRFSQYLLDGKDIPPRRAIELYGPYVSRWKPGTYVAYSNAPPVIAAYIVEKVSGMSWADFTRTRIFEPLGMTSAHWTRAPEIEGRLSKSYRTDGVTEEPYVDIPGKPAGSLNVTPSDLAKFELMLIGRGTYDGVTLLSPASVDRIETPASSLASRSGLKLGYGLGNLAIPREKALFHGHDGGIDGFLSTYLYEPSHGAGLVAMVNAPNGEVLKAMEMIVGYLQRDWPTPEVPPSAMSSGELTPLAGVYQPKAPRIQMLAPLEALLDWTMVKAEGDKIVLNDIDRVPVGKNLFQRVDRMAPTVLFVDTAEGTQMLTATSARRQVPQIEVFAKAGFGLIYALALVVSGLFFFIWMIGWFGGRLADRGGVLVRAVPLLAILNLPVFAIDLLFTLGDGSWDVLMTLGTPSVPAQVIYGLSIAAPVLGVLAVVVALTAGQGTPRLVRGLAMLNGALVLVASAYLWPYGWIGLKTWI